MASCKFISFALPTKFIISLEKIKNITVKNIPKGIAIKKLWAKAFFPSILSLAPKARLKSAVVPVATAIKAGIKAYIAAVPTPTELIALGPKLATIIISNAIIKVCASKSKTAGIVI